MINTEDGWQAMYCPVCGCTYRLPKEENGGLAIWAMLALMAAFSSEHKDCGAGLDPTHE